jgi:hypothetical protein
LFIVDITTTAATTLFVMAISLQGSSLYAFQ